MKNKKMIIIILIIILIILTILGIVINKKNKSLKKSQDDKNNNKVTVNLSSVYGKEDITTLDTEKTKDVTVAEKYNVGSNTYKLNANVDFKGINGEMIFLREDNNKANIFQTKYKIDLNENTTTQITMYMREFLQNCMESMEIDQDKKPDSEKLYGESSEKYSVPLQESIFYENKLYSLTYKVDENREREEEIKSKINTSNLTKEQKEEIKAMAEADTSKPTEYNINFYRNGDYLVCEFVKIFE